MDCEDCHYKDGSVCQLDRTWDVYWSNKGCSSTMTIHGERPEWLEDDAELVSTFKADCFAEMKEKAAELIVAHISLRSLNGETPLS